MCHQEVHASLTVRLRSYKLPKSPAYLTMCAADLQSFCMSQYPQGLICTQCL